MSDLIHIDSKQASAPRSQESAEVASPSAVVLEGKDNRGKPRQAFADEISKLSDEAFLDAAEKKIWLSAYANNNPRSDYHWQADAFYDEAARRGKPELYSAAWKQASRSAQ